MPLVNNMEGISEEALIESGILDTEEKKKPKENTGLGDRYSPAQLAIASPEARATALDSVGQVSRTKLLDALVGHAMTRGLTTAKDISEWIGHGNTRPHAVGNSMTRVMDKWIKEVDGEAFANKTRAKLIKSMWNDISAIETKAQERYDDDKVEAWMKLKELKLKLLQEVAKLAYIELLKDKGGSNQNIVVVGSTAEEGETVHDMTE